MSFIDLHCHILWDLDDGCQSPEETLAAARALAAAGFTEAAPSPHVQARYGGGDAALSRARLEEARALLERERVGLRLHASGENIIDGDFLGALAAGATRRLGDGARYALVEVPFLAPAPMLGMIIRRMAAAGVRPIIAHPERCVEFEQPGRAEEMVELGAALQLNLGAITGRHGPRARELAERLLERGLYAVAGTDLHAPDGAERWLRTALAALEALAGREAVERLCAENPRRALAGEDLA
jgi:protein-tyrosine phosphatase